MQNLPRLNLPPAHLRVKTCDDGIRRVFDPLRDKFVALTPEEWVRQNFVAYLVDHLGYPAALMANEVPLTFNNTSRRCDTVLFRKRSAANALPDGPTATADTLTGGRCPLLRPLMIVEYKAPSISITQSVFDQIARYNLVMGAPLLIVTNGMHHFCCIHRDAVSHPSAASSPPYRFLRDIPNYQSIDRL